MNNALALIQPTEYDLMAKLAKVAALSGYSQQTEVQVFFLMLKGFEIGVSPMQALDGIQVIKGKTTVAPQLMLALINRSGQLEDMKIDGNTKQCTVTMQRKGRSPHTETFTMDNAQSMGLAGNYNWKAQPATMLKWRAVSACARIVFPDVIQGMYTPEEMGAEVSENANGDIVIEAPMLDANFIKAENEVARLAATNPSELIADEDGVVIEDAVISNVEPPSSDLTVETLADIVVDEISAATAKLNLAGNGAPANGEKKAIGKEAKNSAPGWKDTAQNTTAVFKAVRPLYKATEHMQNSIALMEKTGQLTNDMNVDLAIATIKNHKDETVAPF